MARRIKRLFLRLLIALSVSAAAVMLLSGYAGHLNGAAHPLLAQLTLLFPLLTLINLLSLFLWLTLRRRGSWIPITGYLLAIPALYIYTPLHLDRKAAPEGSFTLLSYNVENFTGAPFIADSTKGAVDSIADYIKRQDADFVCFQETLSGWRLGTERIKGLYPYHAADSFGASKGNTAVTLYSRYPITRREVIAFPSRTNGAAAYEVDMDGKRLLIVNVHLESNHLTANDRENYAKIIDGEAERDTTRKELRVILKKLIESTRTRSVQADSINRYVGRHVGIPIIVCGDFNDNPLSYCRRAIASALTDCYVATGNGPGISYNQKWFPVRIDNIMCGDLLTPWRCHIDRSIRASDHYPILCRFTFNGRGVKKRKQNK